MLRKYGIIEIIFILTFLSSCSNETNINISVDNSKKIESTSKQEKENPSSKEQSSGKKEPQQTYSVETDEITTDLQDGHFVRIQFELVTDSEVGKVELEEKDFQVRNTLIKEVTQLTSQQLENVDEWEARIIESVGQLLKQGHILEVNIVEKLIQ